MYRRSFFFTVVMGSRASLVSSKDVSAVPAGSFVRCESMFGDLGLTSRLLCAMCGGRERIEQIMSTSLMLVTALNPVIGYDKASEVCTVQLRSGTRNDAICLVMDGWPNGV